MKWLLLLVPILAWAGGDVVLYWDRDGQYLYNESEYFYACRLIVSGRTGWVYWDLYPRQRTVSYRRIEEFECR